MYKVKIRRYRESAYNRRAVSIRAIVKAVQISDGALKRYPKVKLILDQVVREGGEKRKKQK